MASRRKLARITVTDPRADGWEPDPATRISYESIRDGSITRQPEQLRRAFLERREGRRKPPPETGHEVVSGRSGESFPVPEGAEPELPDRKLGRVRLPPDERWCSICLRFMTAKEIKTGHVHGPKPPSGRPPPGELNSKGKRKRRRKSNWRYQGASGDGPRSTRRAERVIRGRGEDGRPTYDPPG